MRRSGPGCIRFYDNDSRHIDAMKAMFPSIESIKIDSTAYSIDKTKYFTDFIRDNPSNSYCNFMTTMTGEEKITENKANHGISRAQLLELQYWGESCRADGVVLFDWDRTISCIEGVKIALKGGKYLPYAELAARRGVPAPKIEDFCYYLVGGKLRANFITRVYLRLKRLGVKFYVITNNDVCSIANELFVELVRVVFPGLPKESIHCVKKGVYKNKAEFLKSNPFLKSFES